MASATPHIDLTILAEDLEAGAAAVLRRVRPHWQPDHVIFKLFTDGITNKLVGCFNTEETTENFTNGVLVRVYGPNTDLLIDRRAETENIKLLQGVGFAPPLFATFNNGLAYQYIPGEVLTVDLVQSPSVYPLIARRMAQLHKLHLHGIEHKPQPALWSMLDKFIGLIPTQYSSLDKHQRYVSAVPGGVEKLQMEMQQLKQELSSLDSPVVFCHNDLLLANIIHRLDSVSFIDFEYAAYNYQAFDIGNHFDEFAGVSEVDFSRYPNEELQWDWLQIYLLEYTGKQPTHQDIGLLYEQVNKFALSAHFLWGIWALVQAQHSNIDFDFIQYASLRLGEYFTKKGTLLATTMQR